MLDTSKIRSSHWILLIVLAVAIYACYNLIKPYLGAIILGFLISLLFFPLHKKIEQRLANYANLAAIISCSLLTIMLIIPMIIVIWSILNEGVDFFTNLFQWITDGSALEVLQLPVVQSTIEYLNKFLPYVNIDQQEIIGNIAARISSFSAQMLSKTSAIFGNITGMLINFLFMLFVLFFFLRDHDSIINTIKRVVPLSKSQKETLSNEILQVTKSAVFGSFITAVVQGILGGFAMWLAGFSGLFWGSIMAFASFIPMVGCAMVWLPASLYLAVTGQWEWAIFLCVWGVVVVGTADNFLRPFLMQSKDSSMNTLLIFFSLLGGLHVYGLLGLIYGPIIFTLTIVLFKMYESAFSDFLNKQESS